MSCLETNLAAIHGFIRATAGDVPAPSGVTAYDARLGVHLQFSEIDALREWAAYLQVDVKPHEVELSRSVHHNAEAVWGPLHGQMVPFHMVHIEHLPEPMPSWTYTCERCGATFGSVGGVYGNEDDEAAAAYDQEEIGRHEAGECVPVGVTG